MFGLAAFVDWTQRPPAPPPCWETDPWREGVPVDEWLTYESDEAARLAPTFVPAPVSRQLAIEAVLGHAQVTTPARSQSFAAVKEMSDREAHTREYRRRPLSAAARALERASHRCGLACYAEGCAISGLPAPTANTTTEAGTSRPEDASPMRR